MKILKKNPLSPKIIIVEDHLLMRKGIRSTLLIMKGEFDIIGEAESGEEFFSLIEDGLIPDLLLLDIGLPGMSGIEVAKRMREEHPLVKILVLTSQSDLETIERLLDIGLDGFISKTTSSNKFLFAVRDVITGYKYYGQETSKIIYNIHIAKKDEETEPLTHREKEILRLCGKGFNVRKIAEELNISTRTVETHKTNIFAKLGLKNTIGLVKYAIRHGIIKV